MDICGCGLRIDQPATGRRRAKCLICSPPDRRDRSRGLRIADAPAGPTPEPVEPALVTATRDELGDLADSADGLVVLQLARGIAAGGGTASGLATLARQFATSKAELLKRAPAEVTDPVTQLFGPTRASGA